MIEAEKWKLSNETLIKSNKYEPEAWKPQIGKKKNINREEEEIK